MGKPLRPAWPPLVGQMADKVHRPKGEPRVLRVNVLLRGGALLPGVHYWSSLPGLWLLRPTWTRPASGSHARPAECCRRVVAEQSTALRIIAWLGPVAPVDLISTQTAAARYRSGSSSHSSAIGLINRLSLAPTQWSSALPSARWRIAPMRSTNAVPPLNPPRFETRRR